jgi:hypothetical protein
MPQEDTLLYPRLFDLTRCLCQEITDSGLPDVCSCTIVPGTQATADGTYGCENTSGLAWVRLAGIVSRQGAQQVTSCVQQMTASVEMGVIRSMAVPENGEPLSEAELLAASQLQLADMAAMMRAFCCWTKLDHEGQLLQYTPVGPQGGTVGGTWTVVVPLF